MTGGADCLWNWNRPIKLDWALFAPYNINSAVQPSARAWLTFMNIAPRFFIFLGNDIKKTLQLNLPVWSWHRCQIYQVQTRLRDLGGRFYPKRLTISAFNIYEGPLRGLVSCTRTLRHADMEDWGSNCRPSGWRTAKVVSGRPFFTDQATNIKYLSFPTKKQLNKILWILLSHWKCCFIHKLIKYTLAKFRSTICIDTECLSERLWHASNTWLENEKYKKKPNTCGWRSVAYTWKTQTKMPGEFVVIRADAGERQTLGKLRSRFSGFYPRSNDYILNIGLNYKGSRTRCWDFLNPLLKQPCCFRRHLFFVGFSGSGTAFDLSVSGDSTISDEGCREGMTEGSSLCLESDILSAQPSPCQTPF